MRYEVMRLMQFVFSICLVLGAFCVGMYVGWRRWGRQRPVATARVDAERPIVDEPDPVRAQRGRDLFAPEVIAVDRDPIQLTPIIRGELTAGRPGVP